MRLRFSVGRLMLVVLAAGLLLFGAEMVRRALEPRPPLRWPWVPVYEQPQFGSQWLHYYPEPWVNLVDVYRGLKRPRIMDVHRDGRVEPTAWHELPPGFEPPPLPGPGVPSPPLDGWLSAP